jgi:hypothetical protein
VDTCSPWLPGSYEDGTPTDLAIVTAFRTTNGGTASKYSNLAVRFADLIRPRKACGLHQRP